MTRPPFPALPFRGAVVFIALHLIAAMVVPAQPIPKITTVSPEWVQRGTTVEITLSGENLTNATRLLFSSESETNSIITALDLKPKDEKTLTARLNLGADAALGEYELRAVTPNGVSEPMALNLGQLPEVRESGTNNSAEAAQLIEFPSVMNGLIKAPAETDYYRFHAQKGDSLIFEVLAARMGSPLDSSLVVLSADARELNRNEDANGLDSLIEFTPPADGDYLLQLRDFRYQGGGEYKYRLYCGTIPYLSSFFPLGGRRGETVEVQVHGRNLAGGKGATGSAESMSYAISTNSPAGLSEIRGRGAAMLSNPRPFEIGDLPEMVESEPNDKPETANAVSVPATINGRIEKEHDVDVFSFKSDKDQQLICEVSAQRLGSRLDALLTLTDAAGKVLAQNDDAAGMDARIDYDKFKKDEEYRLRLRDLNDRGGEGFGYRLSVHGLEPDFQVRFYPDIPRVTRGGHATVRCEVTRGISG